MSFQFLFKVKLLIKLKMLASHWNRYFNTLRLVIDWQCQNIVVKICEDYYMYSIHNFLISFIRYELMLKCWDYNPNLRPSFDEIVTLFDGLLSLAHVST